MTADSQPGSQSATSEAGNHDIHKDGGMALASNQRRAESAEWGVRGKKHLGGRMPLYAVFRAIGF